MLPVAMLVTWAAYTVGSWGYCLIKGYDVSFRAWASPLHPYSGPWPPPLIPINRTWPHPASFQANQADQGSPGPDNPGGLA
jgi:hypothetical protein